MAEGQIIEYGPGGFDPNKPAGNVIRASFYQIPQEAINRETIETRARVALTANQAFLALATPTAGQVRDQTIRLTRECSTLIRLMLDLLDDVSDS